MSQEKEEFKQDCIKNLEFLIKTVSDKKTDPRNAALNEYLSGYESGLKVILEIIKDKKTD